eukprot:scaffold36275_cov154-Isochrysis_galbana.AAC.40
MAMASAGEIAKRLLSKHSSSRMKPPWRTRFASAPPSSENCARPQRERGTSPMMSPAAAAMCWTRSGDVMLMGSTALRPHVLTFRSRLTADLLGSPSVGAASPPAGEVVSAK